MSTKDQVSLLVYIKNLLTDLLFVNSIIATELIKITENTASLRHGEEFLQNSPCIPEHDQLNQKICEIMSKYKIKPEDYVCLEKHVLKQDEDFGKNE